MWLLFALGSALFAGMTAILAKIGMKNVNSTLATAIRTVVVLIFAWGMVFFVGSQDEMGQISGITLLFLVLSGMMTGASWLCYFKALQLGSVSKVAPVDKSSIILTVVLAFLFFGEPVTLGKILGLAAIGAGTLLMVKKNAGKSEEAESDKSRSWLLFAVLSAVFASMTAIFGKIGIQNVESNLGTAIRTVVVLAFAWLMVGVTRTGKGLNNITKHDWLFLILSGVATGASWLCYYHALQGGPASVVVPVDKLSIVVTVVFAVIFLKEKLSKRAVFGLLLIAAGTLAMVLC
ncbi:MAG: EamA family transporter [Christensenella sp.]|nr:EamA family transporter [Christensenella sp.]